MSAEVFENFNKNKTEIEKLISEWEAVRQIFDSVSKIAVDCEIEFETVNFKDKIYRVVKHDNFEQIKLVMEKNLEELTKNLEGVENFKYQSATVEKMKKFRKNMIELNDIIFTMEEQQKQLEGNMQRQDIYLDPNAFAKLKEAEGSYKTIIERIHEKKAVMEVLKVRDFFKSALKEMKRAIDDIPLASIQEENN
mmetsp:Transcript_1934/g.1983  ORF Transcript_1934/g.1983 Transcript_1934/m.1983 type:complete len:194 (-) Transcript_1934:66-647(-)